MSLMSYILHYFLDANVSNSNLSACNNGRRLSLPTNGILVATPVGPTGSKVFQSERKNIYPSEQGLEISAQDNDFPSLPSVISNMEPTYDPTPKSLVGTIKSSLLHEEYDPVGLSDYKSDDMPTYLPGSLSDKADTTSNTHDRIEKPLYVPESIPAYIPGSVPEYNPTPIIKLKKVKTLKGTDLEYDPVSNFAYSSNSTTNDITEVQYIPLKRARFDDFPSADEDAMSVHGFGDSDSAKFSDSDAVSEKSESTKADLYAVTTSESSREHVKSVSVKTPTTHTKNIMKSTKQEKGEKVIKSKMKDSIEKTISVSSKDTPGKGHTSATKQEIDKKGKHKSSSNIDRKDLKKDKEKVLMKKESSSESSHLKSASTMSPSNSASKSSKSASKHSFSSSSSAKSSSSSAKSSSKSISSSQQTSKHTSSSSKASNKDTSLKSNDKQTNSIHSKDKNYVKKHDSVSLTSSQDGKKSLSKHHSKAEKENVKNSKGGSEKSSVNDNKNIVSSKTQPKAENAQDPKVVTKTLCADLFGQDSDYSDLSDLDEDDSNKTQEMTEEQLQQFLDDSDFECDGDTYDECLRIFNEGIAKSCQPNNTERKVCL